MLIGQGLAGEEAVGVAGKGELTDGHETVLHKKKRPQKRGERHDSKTVAAP
jgi:hypothetical protein